MLISNDNKFVIEKIYLHDSIFGGLTYNYKEQTVFFACENSFLQTRNEFTFQNVIFFEMQSCSFWNQGMNIYGQSIIEMPRQMENLLNVQQQNSTLFNHSLLTQDINYFAVEFQLNSGDTLLVICESIEWEEIKFGE